jgi:putative phosphoribosyl transferase
MAALTMGQAEGRATVVFCDRAEAGRRLAERLLSLKATDPVVFALPRGGVPVAVPIAKVLEAPLDILLVRKIGAPGQPELALGAVVEGKPPQTVMNSEIIRALGLASGYVEQEVARQLQEIERRRRLWAGRYSPTVPHGRTIILVDDGIATGATVRSALLALQLAGAARRVLAVPVAPRGVATALRSLCDDVVCLTEPPLLGSVGAFYNDFRQLADEEVISLLEGASASQPVAASAKPTRPSAPYSQT